LRANEDSRGGSGKVGPGGTAATWLLPAVSERFGLPADIEKTAAGRIVPFAITPLAVSATLIRQRLAAGKSIRHLVSDSVLDYIATHSIY
jgi:nicotinate-nucleotide adenylyltransferase